MTGNVDVGGLVGDNASATVSNSYSTGSITRNSGSTDTDIGGFCGELTSSTIEYCYSTGSVDYTDAENPSDKGFVER
ncbi:MAG: GLUG motif-containing protein [Candidatus Marinimicrobia bacterium]|nr:GLUG motif-containing protein [Candidatus Neomarinimicrobiota bacterium]